MIRQHMIVTLAFALIMTAGFPAQAKSGDLLGFQDEYTQQDYQDDLEAYFGRLAIHDEVFVTDMLNTAPPMPPCGETAGATLAAGFCAGGDAMFSVNNGSATILAETPSAFGIGVFGDRALTFGQAVINGGVAVNNGSLYTYSGVSELDGIGTGNPKAISYGMWVTRSGLTPFSDGPEAPLPGYSECVAVNNGTIAVSTKLSDYAAATSFKAQSLAAGIGCGEDSHCFNSGQILVDAAGGLQGDTHTGTAPTVVIATGIYGNRRVLCSNTGTIAVTAHGDNAQTPATSVPDTGGSMMLTSATGIAVITDSTINNSGMLTSTAYAGTTESSLNAQAFGIEAGSGSTIVNSGTINASAVSAIGHAKAYGIMGGNNCTLHSTGFINASASTDTGTTTAYDVYATDGTFAVREYAILLAHDPDAFIGRWRHGSTGTFDLADSTLHVHVSPQTLLNTPYKVDEFVAGEANAFESIVCDTPADVDLEVIGANEAVRLNYNPKSAPALKAVESSNMIVSKCVDISDQALVNAAFRIGDFYAQNDAEGTMLASAGGVVPGERHGALDTDDKSHSVFLMPYVIRTDDDDYTGTARGISAGYNRAVSSDDVVGFHVGVGSGDINFASLANQDRKVDISNFSLGVQGLHRFSQSLALRASSTLFISQNEFRDDAPANREHATYGSRGASTMLTGSYECRPTEHTLLAPELSLRHEWIHQDGFTTSNVAGPSTTYGDVDENELYATASLRLMRRLAFGDVSILPSLRIFADQVLTDGETASYMELLGSRKDMTDTNDDMSFGAQASCTVTNGDTSLELGYSREENGDRIQQSGWLQVQVNF
ncbi:hypothetical protein GGQ74_000487 [Desulfobaculum xiamenense]|uniref:Autotransporter domain-containing protein n=1 Tax=Desulfobaculum xiamenense TaxID=995050 RepID=A0A846QIG7_9BACT|nr:autotransporter outer membrane beta-barrel domain-containing protein [Desulfobaculum xiamenense]NJB66847.1 hypothetical protein [Desulfobaculum xiamenense]